MKILFTGGGTGGHIFPIIAIAREIRRIRPEKDIQFFYIGPKDEFGSILLEQEKIKAKNILAGKFRRYFSLMNFVDIFKLPIGLFQSFWYIFFSVPDLIFSIGGYGSLPPVLAGWMLATPIFLHECNVVPGLANKVASKFSLENFVSFPRTEYFSPESVVSVGNPIRREILSGSKDIAQQRFKLTLEKPVVLILGGSQGAQPINDMILNILPEILNDFELIHQCGKDNFKEVQAESRVVIPEELQKYYHLVDFLKEQDLRHAYAAAKLIVSRAGSSAIFEITALGKASILIPLPHAAQEHQLKNAYALARAKATMVIEENNLTPRFFLERAKYLLVYTDDYKKMAKRAKEWARPRAAKLIAEYIVAYLSQ